MVENWIKKGPPSYLAENNNFLGFRNDRMN